MKQIISTVCMLFVGLSFGYAQEFTTLTYYEDDTLKLDFDLFMPQMDSIRQVPIVIYVHGGGFSTGSRNGGHNLGRYLSQNGYATATITYTLYMKGKNFSCEGMLTEKIKAIQIAANQLWLSTVFLIENADKIHIDQEKIFIAGSSAGAETVLHAAFWDYETMNLYNKKLPDSFTYAGIISGAGAIMDMNLITNQNKIPIMMFHGNNDKLVPYGTAAHHFCKTNASGWLMLFGSYSIFNHINSLNGTTHLVTFCGGGHEYAGTLFYENQQPIVDFLDIVLAGEKIESHTIISTGKKSQPGTYDFCN